jgi:hypothetical protein
MEKEPVGLLFNSIPYYSQEHINSVIDEMTKEQAIFFASQAIQYSFSQGAFNLLESEIISKSIRKLSEK